MSILKPGDARRVAQPERLEAAMPKVRVESFTISLDGFGAGPDQDIQNPLGVGGAALHGWEHKLFGNDGGAAGLDDDFAASD